MRLAWIELRDFRNHTHTRIDPVPEGLVVAVGPNGEGNVYTCWNEAGQRVFCSVSTDFGTTWTHHLVWDGGLGTS